ncbi:MAG TPA: carboxypeptidase-like regulatory domain-containing protein [Longimicrobium sp.]|nr:carboxypeptidase-like regulatory domain-containing protein [Longimicrobium sp.]
MKPMMWMCLAALLAAAPAAGAQTVSGTVVGDRGLPVAYATVMVADRDGAVVAAASADRRGRFSLLLPAGGSYRLLVRGDSHASAERRFRVAGDGTYSTSVYLGTGEGADGERTMSRRPMGTDSRPVGQPGGPPGGTGGGRGGPTGSDN